MTPTLYSIDKKFNPLFTTAHGHKIGFAESLAYLTGAWNGIAVDDPNLRDALKEFVLQPGHGPSAREYLGEAMAERKMTPAQLFKCLRYVDLFFIEAGRQESRSFPEGWPPKELPPGETPWVVDPNRRAPMPGATFRHFKLPDKTYIVLGMALVADADMAPGGQKPAVLYAEGTMGVENGQPKIMLKDEGRGFAYVRGLENFNGLVQTERGFVPRFAPLNEAPPQPQAEQNETGSFMVVNEGWPSDLGIGDSDYPLGLPEKGYPFDVGGDDPNRPPPPPPKTFSVDQSPAPEVTSEPFPVGSYVRCTANHRVGFIAALPQREGGYYKVKSEGLDFECLRVDLESVETLVPGTRVSNDSHGWGTILSGPNWPNHYEVNFDEVAFPTVLDVHANNIKLAPDAPQGPPIVELLDLLAPSMRFPPLSYARKLAQQKSVEVNGQTMVLDIESHRAAGGVSVIEESGEEESS